MLVARLLVAKMAAEHPEPPKGELQLPPPPPPGHYGAWAAQELQAKLAEIGAPIQGEAPGAVKGGCVGLRGSGTWLPRRLTGGGRRQASGARPGQAGLFRLVLTPDSVLGSAGSREELVERLQTYTRQVSCGRS